MYDQKAQTSFGKNAYYTRECTAKGKYRVICTVKDSEGNTATYTMDNECKDNSQSVILNLKTQLPAEMSYFNDIYSNDVLSKCRVLNWSYENLSYNSYNNTASVKISFMCRKIWDDGDGDDSWTGFHYNIYRKSDNWLVNRSAFEKLTTTGYEFTFSVTLSLPAGAEYDIKLTDSYW